jgi:hypothetical protein
VALLAEAPVPRLAPVVLLYWCAALLAARDLHGAAMVAGMAIAAVSTGAIWGPCGWRRRGG